VKRFLGFTVVRRAVPFMVDLMQNEPKGVGFYVIWIPILGAQDFNSYFLQEMKPFF
jgi:hypothetical protein